jgi:sortase B
MKFDKKFITAGEKLKLKKIITVVLACIAVLSFVLGIYLLWQKEQQKQAMNVQVEKLLEQKEVALTGGVATYLENAGSIEVAKESADSSMLLAYQSIYKENPDFIGWLSIENTQINYPVMQTLSDENYYLKRGFDKQNNENGCLILDTQSLAGVGTKEKYEEAPSTNLIIHGHNMKSGAMFGELDLYKDKAYEENHNIICFDTLYEKREYKIIAVFYSEVFKKSDEVFKYYQFFNATNEEEFQEFYTNIKKLSIYNIDETAQFGDEFITLSTCSYQTDNGRFVVVGKRVK